MNDLKEYKNKIERLKGQREKVQTLIKETKEDYRQTKRTLKNVEQAQAITQTVAQQTQENLIFNIENIVTSALEAVFDEPYTFHIEFNIKRNKSEASLFFKRDGEKYDPLDSVGYGPVDIASLALRIAAWSISTNKSSKIFVLDEPFKHLSEDLQEKGMMLLKTLSDKLEIQFIIVTHTKEEDILEYADKVFKVEMKNKVSKIKVIKEEEND